MSGKKKRSMGMGTSATSYGYELPDDALRLIFSKMCCTSTELIRLRLVCKSWKRLLEGRDIRPIDRLPWIMSHRWVDHVRSVCQLYVPSEKKTYTIENVFQVEEDRGQIIDADLLDSKHGWVMFQQTEIGKAGYPMFMYCPFTGEVIRDLPNLNELVGGATFSSSSPTSEECVFFAHRHVGNGIGEISICRRGDEAWKTIQFVNEKPFTVVGGVVYSNGAFYCLFREGALGAFTVATQEWVMLFPGSAESSYLNYLIESDDARLLMVQPAAYASAEFTNIKPFRFDFRRRIWVQEPAGCMDRRVVFLGGRLNPFAVPAEGEASAFAGALIDLGHDQVIYSNNTRDFLSTVDAYSNAKIKNRNLGRLVWIQPPNSVAS
ncbi:hypothetical protein Tsubulata_038050 [Turnera subulata]|uniref:F-box domain-containing protein n=1 Tax=Turnera subulata TaxID=218843 RepID=A0A9Q0GBA5_9ROSI|nr:hypothetical protein Tsubulata_038050 [Turnera subulata]